MPATDPTGETTSEDTLDERLAGDPGSGPNLWVETLGFRPPTTIPETDGRSPAEQLDALQEGDGLSGADLTPDTPRESGTPAKLRFGRFNGDHAIFQRAEIVLRNTTDETDSPETITDTLRATLRAVNGPADAPFSTHELWPAIGSGDAAGRETSVTLDPGEETTVGIAGDASSSQVGFVDPEDYSTPLPGSTALDVPLTIEVLAETTNDTDADSTTTPLTLIETRAVVAPSLPYLAWLADGSLGLFGRSDDDLRMRIPPASDDDATASYGVEFPAGANVSALDGLGSDQFVRSDIDDDVAGILSHSAAGNYDQTAPTGDGEVERWTSSLGGYSLSITGGHGRVAHAWNSIYDNTNATWRYVVDNEPAMLLELHNGRLQFRAAPGGVAGDPITFNSVEYDGTTDTFEFSGTTTSGVVWESGTTRPASPSEGQRFFDSSLGQPIWYDGTSWVDAQGTVV